MRIVVDIQSVQGESGLRGIGRYTLGLIKELFTSSHEIVLVINEALKIDNNLLATLQSFAPKQNIVAYSTIGNTSEDSLLNSWRTRASELIREKFINDLKPDMILITSLFEGISDNSIVSVNILGTKTPTAVILYDLIPLIYRKQYLNDPIVLKWYERKLAFLKNANIILAISQSAKDETTRLLGIPENILFVISSAIDENYRNNLPSNERDKIAFLSKHQISKPFFLYVSAYDHRKNFEGLIKAFAKLNCEFHNKYQLVLAGNMPNEMHETLIALSIESGLCQGDVIITGRISDQGLSVLYSHCFLFCFPSFHEGFGLPILEAMTFGAPVIASNRSSMTEIIGIQDALFDPDSIDCIFKKMKEVVIDHTFRAILVLNSKEAILQYSWRYTGMQALHIMEKYHRENQKSAFLYSRNRFLDEIVKLKCDVLPSVIDLKCCVKAFTHNEIVAERFISNLQHPLDI